ncbi:hypothetical protein J14TS2_26290 [Bacillus sp. J14TS2]|nr:hypothetical protein J14TS2_26290 [Bacillus sp. J14TS2]
MSAYINGIQMRLERARLAAIMAAYPHLTKGKDKHINQQIVIPERYSGESNRVPFTIFFAAF